MVSTRLIRWRPVLLSILAIGALYGVFDEGFGRLWQYHLVHMFTFPTLGAPPHGEKLFTSSQEGEMKLLYCGRCGDIVRLYPEKRYCRCGKSWGHYLEDGATTVQTYPGLSLGISNPDFQFALEAFLENPGYFSPILAIRSWVNPLSEPDVKFVTEEEPGEENKDSPTVQTTPEPPISELSAQPRPRRRPPRRSL